MIPFSVTLFILSVFLLIFLNTKKTFILIENIYSDSLSFNIKRKGTLIFLISSIFFFFLSSTLIISKFQHLFYTNILENRLDVEYKGDKAEDKFLTSVFIDRMPDSDKVFQITLISKDGNYVFKAALSLKEIEGIRKSIEMNVSK